MQRQTIGAQTPQTIQWFEGKIVDWAMAGTVYSTDGSTQRLHQIHFAFNCDSAINSDDGQYVFLYSKLGTKGLLIKNGSILREVNRSYYHADTYEYPAVFFSFNGKTYLAHCPLEYCRIDFEDVETGKIITDGIERAPQDVFHSRLEVSPDHQYLLSKGWLWHPFDVVEIFDIGACFDDPTQLDRGTSIPSIASEICTASFIDNDQVLVGAVNDEATGIEEPVPPGHIATWDFKTNQISKLVKVNGKFGNLFAIDENLCWDLFEYPKIIDLNTGMVLDADMNLYSGLQCSSIIHHLDDLPKIAFDRKTKQIAIACGGNIEILTRS